MLTIEAIDNLHPFAFAFLNVLLFESIFSLDELRSPFFYPVLLTHTVKLLVDIGTSDLYIGLVITS